MAFTGFPAGAIQFPGVNLWRRDHGHPSLLHNVTGVKSRFVQNERLLISLYLLNFSKPSPKAEGLEKLGAEAPELPAVF